MHRQTHTAYADAALSLLHDTNQAVRGYMGKSRPSDATELVCTMLLVILRHGACRPYDQVYSERNLLYLAAPCPMSFPVEHREYEQFNPFGLPRPSRGAVKEGASNGFFALPTVTPLAASDESVVCIARFHGAGTRTRQRWYCKTLPGGW